MNENKLNLAVDESNIKIQLREEAVAVASTPVPGCQYAFYLYRNNSVIQKIMYRSSPSAIFKKVAMEGGDAFKVKVFYQLGSLKKSKMSKVRRSVEITKEDFFNYELQINPSVKFTLQNCEIVAFKESKIKEQETIGFKPKNDCAPVKLQVPIPWLEDPLNDRNWMFQLHAWRMLDPYLSRFMSSDVMIIQQIINDWLWFAKKNKSKWLWYDMSTGLRALKIVFYLQKCHELHVDHGIDDINYLLNEHFRHLRNPGELSSGNHGLFQLHGLKALAYIVKDFENSLFTKDDLNTYAKSQMEKLIAHQLGSQGVHTEDSPDYHFFAHKKISGITQAPWWADLSKKITTLLELGERAKPWLISPDSKCVPVGDSTTSVKKGYSSSLSDWPHARFKNYIGARLDGYAVVRSAPEISQKESSFLFFQGSFYSQAHKHCDDLSFILQESGRNILIDSGKYGYQQDRFRKYFLSTAAHNTITVDGVSTSRERKHAYGSAIVGEPVCYDGVWVIKGYVDHIKNQYSHYRILFYIPGVDLYVVDIIENKSNKPIRELAQWWHFDTDANIESVENGEALVSFGLEGERQKIKIKTSCSNGNITSEKFRGYDGGFLAGWASKSYLKYEPTSCLKMTSEISKKQILLTHFVFDESSSNTLLKFEGEGLTSNNSSVLSELFAAAQR